jgi:hypothetical protein
MRLAALANMHEPPQLGADERDALRETLFWLSYDGIREAVATAREEVAAGKGLTEERIRAEVAAPKRSRRPPRLSSRQLLCELGMAYCLVLLLRLWKLPVDFSKIERSRHRRVVGAARYAIFLR